MKFSKKLTLLLTTLLAFASFNSKAQYGNEWINYDQTYYKIKIGAEGIYRIDFQTLSDIDVPVSTLNPKNFQLFLNGEEQHIYINGEADEVFDSTDIIEFYGKKNDGWLDNELYRTPEEQPNPRNSLYSDTSIYFLTWNNRIDNRRINEFYDGNYAGKTSDPYFLHEVTYYKSTSYFSGIPNSNDGAQIFSEYTEGEGFHEWIWQTQALFSIPTPKVYTNGPNAKMEILAYSSNHNTSVIVNNYNHEFGVSIKTKSNLIASKKTLGYERIQVAKDINIQDLEAVTKIYAGELTFSGSGINLSYIKLTYPRLLDLNNSETIKIGPTKFNSSYYNFKNYPDTKTKPIVYDFKNKQRIKADKSGNSIEFNLSKVGSDVELYISDESNIKKLTTTNLSLAPMSNVDMDVSSNYLIVSHKKLQSGAEKYKTYRESSSGGNYVAHIVYTDDLYNQFSYGYLHPLSIKHYIDQQLARTNSIQHILLLGKGQLYTRDRANNALREAYNLVPPIGIPASDMLYVGDLSGSSLKTKVSIGRVPARDNNQIDIYLDKLDAFENSPDEEWKKKIIQLAGGATPSENSQYKSFLNNYFNIASDTSLGAYRVIFSKNDPIPVQTSLTSQIQDEINNGSTLVSYFGHGAAQVTEISLGEPDQLNNNGKTPLFIFNGCALGNTFEDLSLAEKFLFEQDKGSIGWIASSNYGFTFSLYNHTLAIHQQLFQTNYGKSVGSSMNLALNNYGNPNNPLDIMEARQLVYHGDPALILYAPKLPDYSISNATMVNKIGANDSSTLSISCHNLGKAISSKIDVSVTILKSDGSLVYSVRDLFDAPFYTSTLNFKIPNNLLSGLLKFNITIDSANKVAELLPNGESNNTYHLENFFKTESALILSPLDDAILPHNIVNLIVQIPDFSEREKIVFVEWDTSSVFTSIIGIKQEIIQNNLLSTSIILPLLSNQDYYIRVKYKMGNVESEWAYKTFGVIANDNEGWTEGNYTKFLNTTKEYIIMDTFSKKFEFLNGISEEYRIETTGNGVGNYGIRWIRVNTEPIIFNWWPFNGVNLIAINPVDGSRYFESNSSFNIAYSSPWGVTESRDKSPYFIVGQKSGIYNYNTNIPAIQDSFTNFLKRIPNGYHLIMTNAANCDPSNFINELWDELQQFGISKLKSVSFGEPFAIYATKNNMTPATEYLADYSDQITLPKNQNLSVAHIYGQRSTSGFIYSKNITGAKAWQQLRVYYEDYNIKEDTALITVYGTATNSADWKQLLVNHFDSIIDLSSIDSKIYPILKFKVEFNDKISRTCPSISRWKINFIPNTEGALLFTSDFKNIDSLIQKGASQQYSIAFKNISNQSFDSFSAIAYHKSSSNNKIDTLGQFRFGSLQPNKSHIIADSFSTKKFESGNYDFFVNINPTHEVKEITYNNNIFTSKYNISNDLQNPLLDVVFDGNHIFDNDIVSPNCTINVSALDENPFLFIDNIKYIDAVLTKPDGSLDSLTESNSKVKFKPSTNKDEKASLIYSGNNLEEGLYKLKVQLKDNSGNSLENGEYNIGFRVISESQISNFYPYPNPFTTNMKFVYTLTGAKIPDYFKIQIYTLSGKVIREITQSEFGEMKIGNNISKFTWDGTDEFGDQLANGVYLYRVIAKIEGKEISSYTGEDGSQFFANGIGKIYLMR